jgi:hypothetical protein
VPTDIVRLQFSDFGCIGRGGDTLRRTCRQVIASSAQRKSGNPFAQLKLALRLCRVVIGVDVLSLPAHS